VAGPLLGGFFANAPTLLSVAGWRWIFYVNLPIGLIALAAIAARLHLPAKRFEHKLDYLGMSFMTLSSVSLILVSVWGGLTYAWNSPQIIGLLASTIVFGAAFVWQERRSPEPLIPMSLFKNDIFSTSVLLSVLTGIGMFASILYIPQYQQIVLGYSPTKSGLFMLPLMVGVLGASITSGRLITRYGRYRPFPIIGTLLVALGMWLFSHVSLNTGHLELSVWMLIIGAGLGSFMQVTVLSVQNAVNPAQLGTATSSVTFFRTIGSSLGGAVFGTILLSRLNHHLVQALPAAATQHLPPSIQQDILQAFVRSYHDMFLVGIPFALAAFVVALFLREQPLRGHADLPSQKAEDIQSHAPVSG